MNNTATRTYLREQMGCADVAQANAIIAQGLTLATLPDSAHLQGRYELPPLPSEIPAIKPLEELDAGEHDERNAEV